MAIIHATSSPEYARMVAETDGVIPAPGSPCCGKKKLPGMIRPLFRLIDAVGVDHVGIGTDLPAGAAKAEMPDFTRHAAAAAALRDRGMSETEVAKVCSGNWLPRIQRGARVMDRDTQSARQRRLPPLWCRMGCWSGWAPVPPPASPSKQSSGACAKDCASARYPRSERSAARARAGGIPLTSFTEHRRLDLTIDGADEIEIGSLNLIKGAGGALLREKIVAAASERLVIVADGPKAGLERLGATVPVPVEVVPRSAGRRRRTVCAVLAPTHSQGATRRASCSVLTAATGFSTADSARLLIPAGLDQAFGQIIGVVETGLFIGMARHALVASDQGVRELSRPG